MHKQIKMITAFFLTAAMTAGYSDNTSRPAGSDQSGGPDQPGPGGEQKYGQGRYYSGSVDLFQRGRPGGSPEYI